MKNFNPNEPKRFEWFVTVDQYKCKPGTKVWLFNQENSIITHGYFNIYTNTKYIPFFHQANAEKLRDKWNPNYLDVLEGTTLSKLNKLNKLRTEMSKLKQQIKEALFGSPKLDGKNQTLDKDKLKGWDEQAYKEEILNTPIQGEGTTMNPNYKKWLEGQVHSLQMQQFDLENTSDVENRMPKYTNAPLVPPVKYNAIRFQRIRDVRRPERGTPQSAGLDFFIPKNLRGLELPDDAYIMNRRDGQGKLIIQLRIKPFGDILIPSGLRVQLPKGTALIAFEKSGVCTKLLLSVGAKVVDEDYQGEVHIHMINNTNKEVILQAGQKIVQFLLLPILYADLIEYDNIHQQETIRGSGGFGHTDNKVQDVHEASPRHFMKGNYSYGDIDNPKPGTGAR